MNASVRSSSAPLPAAKPRSMTNFKPWPIMRTAAAANSSAMAAKITCLRYGRRKRPMRASVFSAVIGGSFGASGEIVE